MFYDYSLIIQINIIKRNIAEYSPIQNVQILSIYNDFFKIYCIFVFTKLIDSST